MPDARLREYDYGDLTHYPTAQVEEEFPRRIMEPFPNDESLIQVVQRVGAFLLDVLHEYDGKTIQEGIASHDIGYQRQEWHPPLDGKSCCVLARSHPSNGLVRHA